MGWRESTSSSRRNHLFLDKVEVRDRGCMNDLYCVPKILYLCVCVIYRKSGMFYVIEVCSCF